MTKPIGLSRCTIPAASGILRDPPRPAALRNHAYADQFDWDTLFYDVYRVGQRVVFQGPPLLNLRAPLEQSDYFAQRRRGLFPRARLIERNRSSEYWVRDTANHISFDGPLGHFSVPVQPNLSDRFAGRRVLHTLSRNNDIAWIIDWMRFYVMVHGADALLLYDNASTDYTTAQLREALTRAFPDLPCTVVDWPFRYGPQGGMAGAVNGQPTEWDSDYCQTGSLQHARFRFLTHARSALNVDIDEMVLSNRGRSIFDATEKTFGGFIKFEGRWVSATTPHGIARDSGRHGDFWLLDAQETDYCPPKWCVVPKRAHPLRHTWSVHNLFGTRRNRTISGEFAYRHMRGISKGWKENRWDALPYDPSRFSRDEALYAAFADAGLLQASDSETTQDMPRIDA